MKNLRIYYVNAEKFSTKDLSVYADGHKFKSEKRLKEYCLGRFLVKYVLSSVYGVNAPEIGVKNRKPYLINGDIYFSLSHSKNIIMCVFAPFDVGLDIEFMKGRDFDSIYRYLERKCEKPDTESFYRFWTKYEAEIKLQKKAISWFCERFLDHFMLSVCAVKKIDVTPEIKEIQLPQGC